MWVVLDSGKRGAALGIHGAHGGQAWCRPWHPRHHLRSSSSSSMSGPGKFEDAVDQKKYRFEEREPWGLCARQVDQRQGSRYSAYMVRTFGGQSCLMHFFLTGSWTDRRLPKHLDPEANSDGTRPPPHQKVPKPNRRTEQNRKSAILDE